MQKKDRKAILEDYVRDKFTDTYHWWSLYTTMRSALQRDNPFWVRRVAFKQTQECGATSPSRVDRAALRLLTWSEIYYYCQPVEAAGENE